MGLIGSHFLTHLVTPPEIWSEQEPPVYVIPDVVQLSDVHNIRLQELGVGIGIPFQLTEEAINERPVAKVLETEAIRSIVTIVENSVQLVECVSTSSSNNASFNTTNNSKPTLFALEFQYSALEDCFIQVHFYVKLSSNTQKIR